MADKTKVLIKETEIEGYEYKEMPIPVPGEGELLVKVLFSSICGSDISLYKWNESKLLLNFLNVEKFYEVLLIHCCLLVKKLTSTFFFSQSQRQ